MFDLARDVDTHVRTSASSCERAVAPGKTTGALELGDVVTFEGKHLGIRQRLTARVVEMDRPVRFVDEQVRGAFRRLRHVHEFIECGCETLMRDTIEWISPLGPLGWLADYLAVARHLRAFISTKQQALKRLAEEARIDEIRMP